MYQAVFIKGLNMNHELLMKALGECVVIMFMCFHYASAILCVLVETRGRRVMSVSQFITFPFHDSISWSINPQDREFYNTI